MPVERLGLKHEPGCGICKYYQERQRMAGEDAKLRERMRTEVRDLQRRLGVTTLYVTHDQAEALSMSNRIAVMDGGQIVQEGGPRAIYQRPATSFVANFVGASNFIEAEVLAAGAGVGRGASGALESQPLIVDPALGG